MVDYLAELDLIKSNSVLFPENQERKFVDILFLENNEKYKSVNTCKVEVFNNIKYSGKVKTFLILESSNKEGDCL